MADQKISALTESTGTLGSDFLPIVSSSVTVKVRQENILMSQSSSRTRWEDLRVPLTSIKVNPSVKEPEYSVLLTDGAGSVGVFTYKFDAGTQEEAFFSVQIPHAYKQGTNLHPHVHWCSTNTSTGGCVWGLEYTLAKINSAFSATTISTGIGYNQTTPYTHTLTELEEIDGSGIDAVSAMIHCRIFRNSTHASDTLATDASLLEVDFHYEIDAMGSASEYLK